MDMKSAFALTLAVGAYLAAATPDPLITPAAELHARQDAGNSLLGWVSTSGAETFTDLRSCDFPATLTRSGSFAQCCEASGPCHFFSTCSAGTLLAESTSVFCDNGLCNTGVIELDVGGRTDRHSYLGCWATTLGEEPFTLVQDIGDAPTDSASVAPTDEDERDDEQSVRTGTDGPSATTSGADESSTTAETPAATGAGARAWGEGAVGVAWLIVGLLAMI